MRTIYRMEPPLEPEEDVSVAVCSRCGGDIWLDELYGEGRDGGPMCRECLEDLWNALTLSERFYRMGFEPTRQVSAGERRRGIRRVHA